MIPPGDIDWLAWQVLELQSSAAEWQQHAQLYDRTAGIALGMLRVLVAAVHVQPANKGVQYEALAFVQGHRRALLSLLQSAGSATPRCVSGATV